MAEISFEVAPISVVVAAISAAVACCCLAVPAISFTERIDFIAGALDLADERRQPLDHVGERVTEHVALGPRGDGHHQIAGGNPLGDIGHFLQRVDVPVEGLGEDADFVVARRREVLHGEIADRDLVGGADDPPEVGRSCPAS